jgi:hypothetical protein
MAMSVSELESSLAVKDFDKALPGTIGRHPGFTSISLNIAGRCPIAGMT